MKKAIKVFLVIFTIFLIVALSLFAYYFALTSNVKLNENNFINNEEKCVYYDIKDNVIQFDSQKETYLSIDKIPKNLQHAFISVEDKRFYLHKGIDYKSMFRATLNNLKSFSFKEGGSTISQQLIKNTHLSSEKTLKRKLVEIKLTKELENKYSKDEILEKYLNTIYFGESSFGVSNASKKYFNKNVDELSLSESALLAGLIKSPKNYSPIYNYENSINRKNLVLKLMFEQNYITKDEYEKSIKEKIELNITENKNRFSGYFNECNKELDEILDKSPYFIKNCKVYTYFDKELSEEIYNVQNSFDLETNKSILCINNCDYGVRSFYSNCSLQNRQIGSVIKPLAVYAPCVDKGIVNQYSFFEDKSLNINGYSPKNYNEKYLGKITVNKALETSSNSVSVQLLNNLGVEKSIDYLKKLNFNLTKDDETLALSLGTITNGENIKTLVDGYATFANMGNYNKSTFIRKIVDDNNNIIYERRLKEKKVFNKGTCEIINDMLVNVTKNGTGKKLDGILENLATKTGTVGQKGGNSDAYSLSYNNDFTVGVWLGNNDGVLMENKITGGTYPSAIARCVWEYLNNNYKLSNFQSSGETEIYDIDKYEYENNGAFLLADKNFLSCDIMQVKLLKKYAPKTYSNRVSKPKIKNAKLLVNQKGILIKLCLIENHGAYLFRKDNKGKKLIYDFKPNSEEISYLDKEVITNNEYNYLLIPYIILSNGQIIEGDEIDLGIIKFNNQLFNSDDNWWIN